MATVLTTASTVTCTHGGTVTTDSTAKLTVNSVPVRIDTVAGKEISGCPIQDDTTTGTLKCRSVVTVTTGMSAKLQVGGKPVILDSLAGTTTGTPPPTGASLSDTAANQTKLQAN